MIFSDNKIDSVQEAFHNELSGVFDRSEIDQFIFYSLNHFLGYSRTDVLIRKDEKLNESVLVKLMNVIKKLKQHHPIQYILGNAEFYGYQLKVDKNVLIPRQETEELVDWIIKDQGHSGHKREKQAILDIGTGSGCIAIALKKELDNTTIFALDVSENALAIAKENARMNQAEVSFIQSNILELSGDEQKYDIIVSNPPYVTLAEKELMNPNVVNYEPHLALFVEDADPLKFYRAIAKYATISLKKKGRLYFEINEKFGNDLVELLKEMKFNNILLKKDLQGKDRMLRCEL